ncbi:FAD-dependent monooxygenase [Asanoa sp. WMMD1127]|uniref:FAD-dependent monooxygenase n=1 Tax=Asanoa sp. WMMD1127 TaxID=3016107 RepID=UPI002417D4ED|nr:FAD-dependent monooxygenase [Asanoa sp. WMMD1127]MDG4826252.1 FAD-dependent monooxygenase [Asanoa sp. WMMD1127]
MVVIVGAGPVGLMVALELTRRGTKPVVLETLATPNRLPKANGIVGRAVPMLHERGLYEPLTGKKQPRPAPRFMYGGFPLDLRRLADNPVHLLPVPQRRLEAVLAQHAEAAGVEIRHAHTVNGITQTPDTVTVDVEGPTGPYTMRATHLVGADGAHSSVRKAVGITFDGTSADDVVTRSGHLVLPPRDLTRVTGRLRGPGGPYRPYLFHCTPKGVFSFARFSGAGPHLVTTLEWGQEVDDTVPMTVGELRDSLTRVLGRPVLAAAPPPAEGPHVLRRGTSRQNRIASTYRAGRILLAGDAAHVVAGFGGPLLNLGLLDAIDLAARITTDDVDGYDQARRPHADNVLAAAKEQEALLRPGQETDQRRKEFAAYLATETGLRRVANTIAGG